MNIAQHHLEKLNTMSADDFSEWLLAGLREWEESPPKIIPFQPIGLLLSRHSDVGVQLVEVYEKLNAETQSLFKQGLALGIGRCRYADEWQFVLRRMVWLAKTLRAAVTLQPIFRFLKSFLKTADSLQALRSRAYVINILSGWVGEPSVVIELEQLLKEANFFHKTDVPIVFLNLLKVHPERLAIYSRQSRPYFITLKQEQKLFAEPLTLGLVDKMGLDNLACYLPELNIKPDWYDQLIVLKSEKNGDDSWLLKMLFHSESAIHFFRDKDNTYLCYRSNQSAIPKDMLADNYALEWYLDEFFKSKREKFYDEWNVDIYPEKRKILSEMKESITNIFSNFSPLPMLRN